MLSRACFILILFVAPTNCFAQAILKGSPEAARAIADAQLRQSLDDEAWRSAKKLTLLDKIPDKRKGQGECIGLRDLSSDSIGYLEYWSTEIVDIAGDKDMILQLGNPRIPNVWLTDYPTKDLVDGDKVRLVGMIKVTGTKKTKFGETLRVIKLLSKDEELKILEEKKLEEADHKAKAAKAAEEKKIAELKAVEDALYRVWSDSEGNKLFEAKFLEFKNSKTRFQLRNSTEIKEIAIGQLGKADQQLIRDELKNRAAKAKIKQ